MWAVGSAVAPDQYKKIRPCLGRSIPRYHPNWRRSAPLKPDNGGNRGRETPCGAVPMLRGDPAAGGILPGLHPPRLASGPCRARPHLRKGHYNMCGSNVKALGRAETPVQSLVSAPCSGAPAFGQGNCIRIYGCAETQGIPSVYFPSPMPIRLTPQGIVATIFLKT